MKNHAYRLSLLVAFALANLIAGSAVGANHDSPLPSDADRRLADYFRTETARLQADCLSEIDTLEQWEARRPVYRRQLLEMLGLDPLPEKTPLKAMTTNTVEHETFTVENVYFQSRPGLYVTGNFYIPKALDGPAPAVLYVCGHAQVKKDGIAYGSKAHYQHHAGWFARHGYVCLIIDTLQLGEIEGIHHGTYRYGMWWWNSRGYTPAGVEAWNCIRALDYLQERPEVDPERLGVTGRSGGGAYSWWIAAIDDRIQAAVPVAGITDLRNHVVDDCVEGHCDCMYVVNTYRWDYPLVAALVAPRPLLISNTDKDNIFPLDGVVRTHEKARRIYRLYGADDKLGLHITEGPHQDTQELRMHAFVWFNRFLTDENPLITEPAVPLFEPEALKVFTELPLHQINATVHETFVPMVGDIVAPKSQDEWAAQRNAWMTALREKVFRGWPRHDEAGPLDVRPAAGSQSTPGQRLERFDFTSQLHVRLSLLVVRHPDAQSPSRVNLHVVDDPNMAAMDIGTAVAPNEVHAFFAPRGRGLDAWSGDERKQVQIRRRFMLLGQTLDGMCVWDVRRAVQALNHIAAIEGLPVELTAQGNMAGIALYASLFEPSVERLDLSELPSTHRDGPTFLNVLRYLDVPQAVAMAAERAPVVLHQADASPWVFPQSVANNLGWPDERFRVAAP